MAVAKLSKNADKIKVIPPIIHNNFKTDLVLILCVITENLYVNQLVPQ